MEKTEVCRVDGSIYYGNKFEKIAATLKEGDPIRFNGCVEFVDYCWFFDGIIIKTKSGKTIHPWNGDTFEVCKWETI